MTKQDTTNASRNAVFVAARNQGKSTQLVIDAIKACKVDWAKLDDVASIADAYKAGRVCASLGCSEKQAIIVLSLKPHKDGGEDGRRTLNEHMACRAAISAWSTIRLLAGAPSAQTGDKRSARTPKAEPKAKGDKGDISPAMLAVPAATKPEDVMAFALRMADVFTKYQNRNAKLVVGDLGALMRGYVEGVRALSASPEKKLAA